MSSPILAQNLASIVYKGNTVDYAFKNGIQFLGLRLSCAVESCIL